MNKQNINFTNVGLYVKYPKNIHVNEHIPTLYETISRNISKKNMYVECICDNTRLKFVNKTDNSSNAKFAWVVYTYNNKEKILQTKYENNKYFELNSDMLSYGLFRIRSYIEDANNKIGEEIAIIAKTSDDNILYFDSISKSTLVKKF